MGGYFAPEWVATLERIRWLLCSGMGGYFGADWVATLLRSMHGLRFQPEPRDNITYNYAYMPIEVDEQEFGMSRDELYTRLKEYNIFTRRYFYPLVCDFSCYKQVSVQDSLEVARRVAQDILALPIYYDLGLEEVEKVCEVVFSCFSREAK